MSSTQPFVLEDIKEFLEDKYRHYSGSFFIESDPVSIPHRFSKKEDREIAGFLAATISWGQRKTILTNAGRLLSWMDDDPHEFLLNYRAGDLKPFKTFVHRTFNGTDCVFFLKRLSKLYKEGRGLEGLFSARQGDGMKDRISAARHHFFIGLHPGRTLKHFPDPQRGSAAKRLNMFLRWMVRKDKYGIDFGIWDSVKPVDLICPLDVHSGRVARKLGLLQRTASDWKAAEELTISLRRFDAADPIKYDLALFGLGVFEKF